MRATHIGHACWLLETAGGTVLTDPVLSDPFEQGAVQSCPSREVDRTKMPKLDALVLSHRHLDHFHFGTLATFRRDIPIFLPPDPLMKKALEELGFEDLRVMEAFKTSQLGALSMTPIPSHGEDLVEYGTIFDDGTGTLYNQVDCPLSDEFLEWVKQRYPKLDVHLAMFACQKLGFFEAKNEPTGEMHAFNLMTALHLGASLVVPAAAGFRFTDRFGWLNRHVFPISHERFIADFNRMSQGQVSERIDPGDVLLIEGGEVKIERQAADFCRMTVDDTHLLHWDSGAAVPPLEDDNEGAYPLEMLEAFTGGLVENGLRSYLEQVGASGDPLVAAYRAYGVTYYLEIVYPEGSKDWTIYFEPEGYRIESGAPVDAPEVTHHVTASALADLMMGRKSMFYVRAYSRRCCRVFASEYREGQVLFEEVDLVDLLLHFLFQAKISKLGLEHAQRENYGLVPPKELLAGPT